MNKHDKFLAEHCQYAKQYYKDLYVCKNKIFCEHQFNFGTHKYCVLKMSLEGELKPLRKSLEVKI